MWTGLFVSLDASICVHPLCFVYLLFKMGTVSTMPEESLLGSILDKWSDDSFEPMTRRKMSDVWLQNMFAFPQGVYTRLSCDLGTMYCHLCCVHYIVCGFLCWYMENPKTKLEGLFRVFYLSFEFFISFCLGPVSAFSAKSVLWYWKRLLVSNEGQEQEKKTCWLLFESRTLPRRKVLLGPWHYQKKNPAQNSAQLVDAKAKWLESVAIYGFTIKRWEIGALWMAPYNPAIMALLWKKWEEGWNPPCANICAVTSGKIRKGNENEAMCFKSWLLQLSQLCQPLCYYVNISTPFTTYHSHPAPIPDTRAQEAKKIRQWNLKNQDWGRWRNAKGASL